MRFLILKIYKMFVCMSRTPRKSKKLTMPWVPYLENIIEFFFHGIKFTGNIIVIPSFKKKHGGKLFQVELDALQAYAPDDFKSMIIDSVDSLFDEVLYQNMKSSITKSDITGLVQKKLQDLLDELRFWLFNSSLIYTILRRSYELWKFIQSRQ